MSTTPESKHAASPPTTSQAPPSGTAGAADSAVFGGAAVTGSVAEQPMSGMLARRLAQAASGYANDKMIWFVARNERNADLSFEVSAPIGRDERPEAPHDPEFGLFRPYLNPAPSCAQTKRTPVVSVTLHLDGGEDIRLRPRASTVCFGARRPSGNSPYRTTLCG